MVNHVETFVFFSSGY